MNEEGIEKGAILLLSLGEEGATEVFKHLGPREVQKLGKAMSNLKNVTRDKVEGVLRSFCLSAEEKSPLGLNSREYLRTVLTKALGDDKAGNLIDRILQGGDTSGIEGLKWMDSPAVAELIRRELMSVRLLADLSQQATEVTVTGWNAKDGERTKATSTGANLGPGWDGKGRIF